MRRIPGWLLATALIIAHAPARAAAGTEPVTDIGMHEGVAYRIDIPSGWNHSLVVFFHGYAIEPIKFPPTQPASPLSAPLLERGYAVMQSAYSATGWALEQASADTEHLREHFVAKYGKPKQVLALGMSMGGALSVLALEGKPDAYAGGLSLCGAVEPSDRMFQRDFALRAAFDYYFPDLLGPLVPVPTAYTADAAVEAKIAHALAAKPEAANALLGFYGAADISQLPLVIAFNTYEAKDLQQRTHGNPFDNAELIYSGSGDDVALNAGVRRYRSEPAARAYLTRWFTPSGKLKRPLLELHDSGDPLVPPATVFEYALLVQRAGYGDNFVQQYVPRAGHCVFTQQDVAHAFDELIEWIGTGRRPVSGKLN
jgi:pimeloyl-ACP methyl ester carboxylesterase